MYTDHNGIRYIKAYICHPYTAGDKKENIESVRQICKNIVEDNKKIIEFNGMSWDGKLAMGRSADEIQDLIVPIAPHLLFPEFMSEPCLGREVAMNFCKALLLGCDEIWVYYNTPEGMSSGMREEVAFAAERMIEIVFKEVGFKINSQGVVVPREE